MKRKPPTKINVLCTDRVSRSSGIWLWVRYFGGFRTPGLALRVALLFSSCINLMTRDEEALFPFVGFRYLVVCESPVQAFEIL